MAHIRATWAGDRRFDSGRPDGPATPLDGAAEVAQSPVDGLLSALAACTGIDVVEILAKRRTPATRVTFDVIGTRAETVPRRVTRLEIDVAIDGAGIERAQAERAIDLSLTRYCSVRASLDPAIPVTFRLTLNGSAGAAIEAGTIVGAQPGPGPIAA
jgi:putative redox protein